MGINIAGEGGEYESLVLDCPLFSQQIIIKKSKRVMENAYTGRLHIEDAELASKKKKKSRADRR